MGVVHTISLVGPNNLLWAAVADLIYGRPARVAMDIRNREQIMLVRARCHDTWHIQCVDMHLVTVTTLKVLKWLFLSFFLSLMFQSFCIFLGRRRPIATGLITGLGGW